MDSGQADREGGVLRAITRRVVPWIALVIVATLAWTYLGEYRKATTGNADGETTGTVEATGTVPADGQTRVRVMSEGLNLRAEPKTTAAVLKTLTKDQQLLLLEKGSGWYRVRDDAGTEGWVAAGSRYTELVEP